MISVTKKYFKHSKHTHYQFRIKSVSFKKACADIILSQTIESEALKAFLNRFKMYSQHVSMNMYI